MPTCEKCFGSGHIVFEEIWRFPFGTEERKLVVRHCKICNGVGGVNNMHDMNTLLITEA